MLSLAGIVAMLVVAGVAAGLLDRRRFEWRWLAVAVLLVVINDILLTRGYGTIPRLAGSHWNWIGKALALAATLAIASLPGFGWRRSGLTLRQAPGSLRACLPVIAAYMLWFVTLSIVFPRDPATPETIAFQLTMPGLEEEPFYRGILLLALDRAFLGRVRWLGIEWGWGALLSSALFGLAHAFGHAAGGFTFDPLTMALTAVPALLAVWLRVRSGSVVLPVVMHNFGNSIGLLI